MLTGRRCGGTPASDRPPSRISPSLGSSKPASIRSKVLLPQPEGPSRAWNSRSWIARSSASTATASPKRLVTPSISRMGRAPGSSQGAKARRTLPSDRGRGLGAAAAPGAALNRPSSRR